MSRTPDIPTITARQRSAPPRQNVSSSERSTHNAASSPATIAQNAEVMPAIVNGVAATPKAISAAKRSVPPKAFSRASCNDDSTARPARAKM